jgi:drug/metabolite transporter (DMT)-like permease
MNQALKGYIMVLISALCFGSYGVWSRIIGPEFGVFYEGWVRSALVLAVLIPIAVLTKSLKPVAKPDRKWLLTTVLFGAATQAPLYYAYNHMDIGTATLVFYAMFLITSYVVGRIFLGERIGPVKLVSLLLAFSGLVLIFGLSLAKFSLLALALAAINGVASGGEVSSTKKSTQKFSSLQVGIYVWAGILITHLPLSLLTGERQVPFAFNGLWLAMLGFAVAGLAGFWLVIEGYKFVDASIGGLVGLTEVLFGIIFGLLIFGEHLGPSVVVGGGLIILAAMLPDLAEIIWAKRARTWQAGS